MSTFNDGFVEELVVRRQPLRDNLIRAALILAGLILCALGFGTALFLPVLVLCCAGVFFAFRYIGTEYEYSFLSGDVSIDKIIGRRRRRTVLSFACRDVELFTTEQPEGQFEQTLDARGDGKGGRDWFLVTKAADGRRTLLAFSPSDRLLEAFRQSVRKSCFKGS